MGQTRRRISSWVFGLASVLAVAGCGATTVIVTVPATTAVPAVTSAPATAAPTSAPAATGATGGAGNTSDNPDSTYICAASGVDDSGSLIAYLTVAGTDTDTGNSLCNSLENSSSWTAASSIPAGGYDPVPGCYVTSDDGTVTARVYTAHGGTDADTVVLCNSLLEGASLPTLAP